MRAGLRGLAPIFLLAALAASSPSRAQTGGEIYKDKCALCHDGGATGAPRLGEVADWKARVLKGRPALQRSALRGMPGTAMVAKGGFPELPDAAITAAVDFMLSTVELYISNYSEPQRIDARPGPAAPVARVDDRTLSANLARVLRDFRGVTFEARAGRVVLKGMVDDAKVVANAERAARSVAGVLAVDNKLISAALFEHD